MNIYYPSDEKIKKSKIVKIEKNGRTYYYKAEGHPDDFEDDKIIVLDYTMCGKPIRDYIDKKEKEWLNGINS